MGLPADVQSGAPAPLGGRERGPSTTGVTLTQDVGQTAGMRIKRARPEPEADADLVIDLRERLAPYVDADPRPGWQDELLQTRRRRHRPLRAAPLPVEWPRG